MKKYLFIGCLSCVLLFFIDKPAQSGIIPRPAKNIIENIIKNGIDQINFIPYRTSMREMDFDTDKQIDITENKQQVQVALRECRFGPIFVASSCMDEGKFEIISGGEKIELGYSCAGFKIHTPLSIGEFSCPSLQRFANGLLIDDNLRIFDDSEFKKVLIKYAEEDNEIALMSLSEWKIHEGIPLVFDKLVTGKDKTFWLSELSRYKDVNNHVWINKIVPYLKSNDFNTVLRAADIFESWGQRQQLRDLMQSGEYVNLPLISWLIHKRDKKTAQRAIPLLIVENCEITDAYILLEVPSKSSYMKLADIIEYHGDELYLNLVTDTTTSMGLEYDFVKKKLVPEGMRTVGGWSLNEVHIQSKIIAQSIRDWAESKW